MPERDLVIISCEGEGLGCSSTLLSLGKWLSDMTFKVTAVSSDCSTRCLNHGKSAGTIT